MFYTVVTKALSEMTAPAANQEERRTDEVRNLFLAAEQVRRWLFDVIYC